MPHFDAGAALHLNAAIILPCLRRWRVIHSALFSAGGMLPTATASSNIVLASIPAWQHEHAQLMVAPGAKYDTKVLPPNRVSLIFMRSAFGQSRCSNTRRRIAPRAADQPGANCGDVLAQVPLEDVAEVLPFQFPTDTSRRRGLAHWL